MPEITGRTTSPKPPQAESGLGRRINLDIVDDLDKQEETRKIDPDSFEWIRDKHGNLCVVSHTDSMFQKRKAELDKAEKAFHEAEEAFDKYRQSVFAKRREVREDTRHMLTQALGKKGYKVDEACEVEFVSGGAWVEARVWVAE